VTNKEKLLKNIRDDEQKILFAKFIDKTVYCQKNFTAAFTEFFNIFKVEEFLKEYQTDVCIKFFGGFDDAERVIAVFYPDFMEINKRDFPISAIKISYNTKYSRKLCHRDFLGSILGVGINRDKIGDIVVFDDYAVVFVKSEIADFIVFNVDRVGKTKVNLNIVNIDDYIICSKKQMYEKRITAASIRVDAIISSAFNISRSKVSEIINAEKVFINWSKVLSGSKFVAENDVVTVRGKGRIKIEKIEGNTKRGRIIINCIYFQ